MLIPARNAAGRHANAVEAAVGHIAEWTVANIEEADRDAFREIAESELLDLHEGNFARYAIRPGEFAAWRESWGGREWPGRSS